jgi:hypothetical protein
VWLESTRRLSMDPSKACGIVCNGNFLLTHRHQTITCCHDPSFLRAGTMVIITLSTAVVFALVIFPALCCVAPLATPDTGSLHALWSGRFHDFCGRSPKVQRRDTWARGTLESGHLELGEHSTSPRRCTQLVHGSSMGELLQCMSVPLQSQDSVEVGEPPAGWQGA